MPSVTNRSNDRDKHLPVLDRFRGAAIVAVLGLHLGSGLTRTVSDLAQSAHHTLLHLFFFGLYLLLSLGGYGVAIFFVVSGFCIHLSYRRSRNSGWLEFYTRRLFRIYPAYLLSLFLCIVVLPTTRWSHTSLTHAGKQIDLLLHLLLAHNLLPQTLPTIQTPYWTLAIEFQLYLLFPLLLIMARQIGWRQTLIVTAIGELVSRLGLTIASHYESNLQPTDWWGWPCLSPFAYWFSWALGAALAEAFVEKQPLPFAKSPLPLWMWPLLVLFFHNTPDLKNFTFMIAALGSVHFLSYFLARDIDRPPVTSGLLARFLTFMGIISYSLYLLHQPLFNWFETHLPKAHGAASIHILQLALIVSASLGLIASSYLLFRFVETPGIRAGKRVITWLRSNRPSIKST